MLVLGPAIWLLDRISVGLVRLTGNTPVDRIDHETGEAELPLMLTVTSVGDARSPAKLCAALVVICPLVVLRTLTLKVSGLGPPARSDANVTAFAGGDWPLENTKEAAWQEFTRVWNETGMTVGSAFNCDLGCVRAQLFGPHSGRHRLKSDEVAQSARICPTLLTTCVAM